MSSSDALRTPHFAAMHHMPLRYARILAEIVRGGVLSKINQSIDYPHGFVIERCG
jgi:hypothetical protein